MGLLYAASSLVTTLCTIPTTRTNLKSTKQLMHDFGLAPFYFRNSRVYFWTTASLSSQWFGIVSQRSTVPFHFYSPPSQCFWLKLLALLTLPLPPSFVHMAVSGTFGIGRLTNMLDVPLLFVLNLLE